MFSSSHVSAAAKTKNLAYVKFLENKNKDKESKRKRKKETVDISLDSNA
jgi:hypothetical protein